jgi:phosphoenolpyruvate carboxykinase (ATP)
MKPYTEASRRGPPGELVDRGGLDALGIGNDTPSRWNLSSASLYEQAISKGEGRLTDSGAFTALTAPHTGRSPKDKYVVRDVASEKAVNWGPVNVPLSVEHFQALRKATIEHLAGRELFVQDARAGGDGAGEGVNVRVVTPSAWHALFAHNMFRRLDAKTLEGFRPDFTVLHAPELSAEPARHGTRSGTFIALSFSERIVLIGGTRYAGEIKKSVFSILNYLLPESNVFPMHCSANVGRSGDVALFFGLSGTGKTTLSADPERGLIGDDEHGWGASGVFNFEGGCYAKVIRLSASDEPEIYGATQRFGTILENVVLDEATGAPSFADGSITENTRASFPIEYIPNAVIPGRGGHPKNVIFLTCDAFGVLPPIARLTEPQAMYHFLSGYTAKVAGTERGVKEPEATFSTCFGAPFLPRPARVYAELLGARLREHGSRAWLINTGWTGGGFGVGNRISIPFTRAMVHAALKGKLDPVETVRDERFGLEIPRAVPGVPAEILIPKGTWRDPSGYDAAADRLAMMFRENFRAYEADVTKDVAGAGPS